MKSFLHGKRGVALPFTILAMIVISGFVITMSSLNQGLKNQIFHTNNHQLSFLLAYSAFSKVLAKIHSNSWTDRPFKDGPYAENNVAFQGGTYDLFVENSPGKQYQADIYVRTSLAGITRLYFWRIRFNDDDSLLVHGAGRLCRNSLQHHKHLIHRLHTHFIYFPGPHRHALPRPATGNRRKPFVPRGQRGQQRDHVDRQRFIAQHS